MPAAARSGASRSSPGPRAPGRNPGAVCEKIAAYRELGCEGFMPWASDYPDTETLTLFAEQVIPQFR
jgi:hypothetical protein